MYIYFIFIDKMNLNNCTNELLERLGKECITICIDKWNWYEDLREDYYIIYIHKNEYPKTIKNAKLKWKTIALQLGVYESYWDMDNRKLEWPTENLWMERK